MLLLRMLHWAFRIPVIPQGHEPGCQAGITKPPSSCTCDVRKLRPPRLGEALMGLF